MELLSYYETFAAIECEDMIAGCAYSFQYRRAGGFEPIFIIGEFIRFHTVSDRIRASFRNVIADDNERYKPRYLQQSFWKAQIDDLKFHSSDYWEDQ